MNSDVSFELIIHGFKACNVITANKWFEYEVAVSIKVFKENLKRQLR